MDQQTERQSSANQPRWTEKKIKKEIKVGSYKRSLGHHQAH